MTRNSIIYVATLLLTSPHARAESVASPVEIVGRSKIICSASVTYWSLTNGVVNAKIWHSDPQLSQPMSLKLREQLFLGQTEFLVKELDAKIKVDYEVGSDRFNHPVTDACVRMQGRLLLGSSVEASAIDFECANPQTLRENFTRVTAETADFATASYQAGQNHQSLRSAIASRLTEGQILIEKFVLNCSPR